MQTFKDRDGRTWEVMLDLPAIKTVRELLKINLLDKPFGGLLEDNIALADTLYVLCRRQCESRGMDDVAFGRAFDGDTLERAALAFAEEVIAFLPEKKRAGARELLTKAQRIEERMRAVATQTVASLNPEKITDLLSLKTELKHLAGSSPASSESAPSDSLSAT